MTETEYQDEDMDVDFDAPPAKRFKHQSYKASLKEVHLPSPLSQSHRPNLDEEIPETSSQFYTALQHARQLSLAPTYIRFANKVDPLAQSLPLLLLNWKEVLAAWTAAIEDGGEGSGMLVELLHPFISDLRATITPSYLIVLEPLLALLPRCRTEGISAETLERVMRTLGALWKWVLIPSLTTDIRPEDSLLEKTWSRLTSTLVRCTPEVQRALAEVWGAGVLRRLKNDGGWRACGVQMLGECVRDGNHEGKGMEDMCAWSVVCACQSVTQTLHTCTSTIIAALLDFHLSSPKESQDENDTQCARLVRRVLTTLLHYVKTGAQFTAVGDELVARFEHAAQSTSAIEANGLDNEKLRKIIEGLNVCCSVRQGSRMSLKQLTSIATSIPHSISSVQFSDLRRAMLTLVVAILAAGDMALWLGPGRKIFSALTPSADFGFSFALYGALADPAIAWGGWNILGTPGVVKMITASPSLFDGEPRRFPEFLARLVRIDRLEGAGEVWTEKLGAWVESRLASWKMAESGERGAENAVEELNLLLTLSRFSPPVAIIAHLTAIIDGILGVVSEGADGLEEGNRTYANKSWVLGSAFGALAATCTRSKSDVLHVDPTSWIEPTVRGYGHSEIALSGLVELVKARPASTSSSTPLLPISAIHPRLQHSLISHSRRLRLATLRLLGTSTLIKSSAVEQDVLKRCLQGEEVSLDVQGVRERLLRIGRLSQVVKEEEGGVGADICVRWLVAQLKINLRPLWSPAAEALALVSQRFGPLVWDIVFHELRSAGQPPPLTEDGSTPSWLLQARDEIDDEDADQPPEDERLWRDASAHILRCAVGRWLRNDHLRREIMQDQICKERFDQAMYESQLLFALGEASALAEKYNRDIVPFFLSFAGPDSSTKLPRHKLSAWLTLFSKFTNPKAIYSTDILHGLYLSLLSHPDRPLQRLALTCLLAYKSARLVPHENRLHALLDDNRWREELVALDMDAFELRDRKELVDIIIRLLFGMMLEKRGRSRGADRRAAVLGALAGCSDQELSLLVDLMLQPLDMAPTSREGILFAIQDVPVGSSEKQQIGFLTLLGDVLKNLGSRLVSYWPALLWATLDLASHAQSKIESSQQTCDTEELGPDVDAEELEEAEELSSPSKIIRSVRLLGLKRFADFFRNSAQFDFGPYMAEAFRALISPRLPALDKENTQAPSALLELFYTWTLEHKHVKFLVQFDQRTLPQMYACLTATNVKPAVISRIFDIVDRVLAYSTGDEFVAKHVVQPHASLLLTNLSTLIQKSKGVAEVTSPLGQRQIGILSEIAQYLTDESQASTLLVLFSPLLRKPNKLVSEKLKVNILKIVKGLFVLIPELADRTSPVFTKTYDLLSKLFQSLRFSPARKALVATFDTLAEINPSMKEIAQLLGSLNAFSVRRLEEPDFDRRLNAFAMLNETVYRTLTTQKWQIVLYNMLLFIQDPDELAIRNNAAYSMKHFIDLVAGSSDPEYEALFIRILYPGLKNGLRSKNELVRAEILGVVAYAVTKCDHIGFLREMRVLMAAGDEEANFFNNIHHVQIHRRTRALHRLGDQCDEGLLRSTILAEIFAPLVSNYIVSAAVLDHHLVNEAIVTMGRMSKQLAWGAYYALVQKYIKASRERDESERVYVRTLVAILESFHFSMEESVPPDVIEANEDLDADAEDAEADAAIPTSTPHTVNVAKIADAVNSRLLPNLLNHLEKQNATEDSLRLPIAIGIVKVAKHLPMATREPQIARLLTILSQILRSKSQETRDLVKDTMCRIAVIIGPAYLSIMVREIRAALLRGPQLHVLAYVCHAILVHVTASEHVEAFPTLDTLVDDVAHISAEVVFGQSGKDVQSEDFKTKMREVRTSASKGMDSFMILAKYITPPKISGLLFPLRSIMQETHSIKTIQLVEEVLRRVAGGMNSNKHLGPSELLVLCHTLVNQNAKFLTEAPPPKKRKNHVKADAIVQIKRNVTEGVDHYSRNSFRFVVFGLDLFNTAFRRGRFDFEDTAIVARLESMVPVIGNTLYADNALVLVSGMKSAAAVTKAPLKTLAKSIPVFIRRIIDIIKGTGSTESETTQTAFKSLAIIMRDCPTAQVKEKDLVYLLELLAPDLEDHERQAAVFAMLRAIVARKFVVPEIYDVMDKVSEVMVTNQSKQVQELCRAVLLQFLLDYPQGKGRLRNQMTFMAKNLSYTFESGRRSVMELLSVILAKFQIDLVREYADLLFVGLVMVIANDDSAKCREMAADLIKSLILRLDETHRKTIVSHLHSWATQDSQPQLGRVSSQVYGLLVDVLQQDSSPYILAILEDVGKALERSRQALDASVDGDDDIETELDWQAAYHALIVQSKILRIFSEYATQYGAVDWDMVIGHLLFPHAWVRSTSCHLLGLFLTAVPIAPPDLNLPQESPFSPMGMRNLAEKLCIQLKSEHLTAPLALQVVKNLLYIGKCFCAVPAPVQKEDIPNEKDNSEDEDGPNDSVGDAKDRNPLPWLFSKLSYQARSAHIGRRNRKISGANWTQQPLSIFRWFAAMASHMDADRLETFLVHILTPVYRITEDDSIRDSEIDELKTSAVELQDLIQAKVGTTKFSIIYSRIRQGVVTIRRERKTARVLQVTTDPQTAAKRKLQKNIVKKDSRKRKNAAFADNKGSLKRRREEE